MNCNVPNCNFKGTYEEFTSSHSHNIDSSSKFKGKKFLAKRSKNAVIRENDPEPIPLDGYERPIVIPDSSDN